MPNWKPWAISVAVAGLVVGLGLWLGPKALAWLAAGTVGALAANVRRTGKQKRDQKQHAATTEAHAAELAKVNAWAAEARAEASEPADLITEPPKTEEERERRLEALRTAWGD
jgi:hypothetical protein